MINMKDFFDLIARREATCRNYDPNKKGETESLSNALRRRALRPLLATASLGALL